MERRVGAIEYRWIAATLLKTLNPSWAFYLKLNVGERSFGKGNIIPYKVEVINSNNLQMIRLLTS